MSTRPLRDAVAMALALALLATGCSGAGADEARGSSAGAADRTPATGGDTSQPGVEPRSVPEESVPAPDPRFQIPDLGRCYRMQAPQSRASVASGRRVPCASRHSTVVVHVGLLRVPATAKTPIAQRRKLGARVCAPAYRRAVGGTAADRATSILTWTLFTPRQSQLVRGARWIRCDVVARSGDELIPLPATRPLLARGVPEQLRICQDEEGVDTSCARPHTYRVAAVYREAGAYPDAATYTAVARERCRELTGRDGGFWQPPGEDGWASGDRFIRCLTNSS